MAEKHPVPAGDDDVLTGTVISPDDWRPYSEFKGTAAPSPTARDNDG